MPLAVTEDTPPDMLAGAMDIKVVLPGGRSVNMSVDRSTPMMDLLVQLTTTHKLSLAGHMTVALSESGARLHHLPSTPIGALDTRLLHVAPRNNTTLKRAPLRPNNAQPFQTTFRLQVHLPRNQLFVARVSPDTRLADILLQACAEKNLDPAKYELRHPANLQEKLSLSHTLGDYHLQEVTMVAARPMGSPLTPADIMALQKEEEKRRQQVKASGSAYGIVFNKRSTTNVRQTTGSVSSDSLNGRSISPARSDESANRSISPPAPLPPQRPGRKRRPAPKPPAPTDRIETSSKDESMTNHSRTSSDSSGYHEASVVSESTETRTVGDSSADTLPRRSKLPSSNPIAAKQKATTLQNGDASNNNHVNLSRSLSNLTSQVGISGLHSVSTTSLSSQGQYPRKKKAAPPPPVAPARKQAHAAPPVVNAINVSESSVQVPIAPATSNAAMTTIVEVKPVPGADVIVTVIENARPEPVKEDVKANDNRDATNIVVKSVVKIPEPLQEISKPIQEISKPVQEVQTPVQEIPTPVQEVPKPVHHVPKPVPEVSKPAQQVSKPVTVSPMDNHQKEKALPTATERKPATTSPVPVAKASTTQVPTSQRADTESDVVSENDFERDRCPSSELESSEWEYQLPDPPSAFRDLESPTLTEFGTVALADTPVFHEPQIEQRKPSLTRATVGSKSSRVNDFDDGWEPQTLGVEEIIHQQRPPKFINSDLRLREDGVTKEVYKVNPIFNAQQYEEESSIKKVPTKYAPAESEIIEKSKNLLTRSVSNDLQSSNQLRNFTISAYEKPQNVDVGRNVDEEFKKPLTPKPSKPPPLARTNSYTSNDVPRPPPISVKRSTSYIALARPYSRPSSFQSINRTKSISSLVEEDSGNGELRKATSEVNVSRAAMEEEPMLASLIILKSILSQSQSAINNESTDNKDESEVSVKISEKCQDVQDVNQEMERKLSATQQTSTNGNSEEAVPVAAEDSIPANVDEPDVSIKKSGIAKEPETVSREPAKDEPEKFEPKPFVYLGPPAINFGSWSERPKVQVSIKSDRDYRFGGQVSNISQNYSSQNNTNTAKPVNKYNGAGNRSSLPANYTIVEAKPAKIEPTPLTMRIVTHTTSSESRDHVTSRQAESRQMQPPIRQEPDEVDNSSRLPIVRSVELKKSVPDNFVQLRNKSSTHLNGGLNNIAQVSINNYQGNIINRHSYVESDVGILPSHILSKSMSSSQLNVEAPNKLVNMNRKYTSVVGINGGSASSMPRPPVNAKPDNFKSNVFSAPKPMPTVKGFRMASGDTASIKEELPTNPAPVAENKPINYNNNKVIEDKSNGFRGQPLKTINGAENVRSQLSWAQRNEKFTPVNSVPATVIKFKKPVQRPLEKKFTNPRDALMDAIKNFGGQDAMKRKNDTGNGSS